MTGAFWSEWDGRGRPDALALAAGDWTEDIDDAKHEVRRLGCVFRDLRLEIGWIGTLDDDLVYDACTEDGECLDTPGTFVDDSSLTQVTFAYSVVN